MNREGAKGAKESLDSKGVQRRDAENAEERAGDLNRQGAKGAKESLDSKGGQRRDAEGAEERAGDSNRQGAKGAKESLDSKGVQRRDAESAEEKAGDLNRQDAKDAKQSLESKGMQRRDTEGAEERAGVIWCRGVYLGARRWLLSRRRPTVLGIRPSVLSVLSVSALISCFPLRPSRLRGSPRPQNGENESKKRDSQPLIWASSM
jgi:hypothetical protein